MTRPSRIPLLLLVGAALFVAGCGDGGDDDGGGAADTSGGGEALTKEEFIAQADQICAEGDVAIDEAGRKFPDASGEELDQLVGTVIAPGMRAEIEQLRELNPPAADAEQIEEWLDTFEQGVEQLEANPDQLAGGQALDTIIEARGLAAEYGMVDCARGA